MKRGSRTAIHALALLAVWASQLVGDEPHWSFLRPERPALPEVEHADWVRNPIARFVLARLEAEAILPSLAADRSSLLLRVSLDLTERAGEVVERVPG